MHRVKGLEFDEIIIASVNDSVVPLQASLFGDLSSDIAEETDNLERALLYVAATEQRKKVLMTCYGKTTLI